MNPESNLRRVSVLQIEQKCRSKKELYQFLSQDCQAFLPRLDSTNVYFLKQIANARKEYIKRPNVKVSAIPHIEGLSVHDFLDYAQQREGMLKFLPDERDWLHLDRQWICDVLYTLDKEGVQQKIDEALLKRRSRLEESKDLTVKMRPEFVDALERCISFSTTKGRSAYLLKDSSSRKRKRQEIEEVQEEEQHLKQNRQDYLREVKRLKQDKQQVEEDYLRLRQEHEIMVNYSQPRGELINEEALDF